VAGASGGSLYDSDMETSLWAGYAMYHRGPKSGECDFNLLDRPCCGNRDLDASKFAFCRRVYLAWPRHMAMLVYLCLSSGVPSDDIDRDGENNE
jgi:hypothetical protein